MFRSGSVTTCFYDLGLTQQGFEQLTFLLRDEHSSPRRYQHGPFQLAFDIIHSRDFLLHILSYRQKHSHSLTYTLHKLSRYTKNNYHLAGYSATNTKTRGFCLNLFIHKTLPKMSNSVQNSNILKVNI